MECAIQTFRTEKDFGCLKKFLTEDVFNVQPLWRELYRVKDRAQIACAEHCITEYLKRKCQTVTNTDVREEILQVWIIHAAVYFHRLRSKELLVAPLAVDIGLVDRLLRQLHIRIKPQNVRQQAVQYVLQTISDWILAHPESERPAVIRAWINRTVNYFQQSTDPNVLLTPLKIDVLHIDSLWKALGGYITDPLLVKSAEKTLSNYLSSWALQTPTSDETRATVLQAWFQHSLCMFKQLRDSHLLLAPMKVDIQFLEPLQTFLIRESTDDARALLTKLSVYLFFWIPPNINTPLKPLVLNCISKHEPSLFDIPEWKEIVVQ